MGRGKAKSTPVSKSGDRVLDWSLTKSMISGEQITFKQTLFHKDRSSEFREQKFVLSWASPDIDLLQNQI